MYASIRAWSTGGVTAVALLVLFAAAAGLCIVDHFSPISSVFGAVSGLAASAVIALAPGLDGRRLIRASGCAGAMLYGLVSLLTSPQGLGHWLATYRVPWEAPSGGGLASLIIDLAFAAVMWLALWFAFNQRESPTMAPA